MVAVLAFTPGCSTKKNTFTRRVYHNLTSHYNVYWNGMDNLRQGIKEYQASLKDNYATVIPVFNYGDKAGTAKINQYAEVSIKKGQKTITKHSMVFNKKEKIKWIDDSYFLMGKGYFYKQDYGMARRTFEFVIKTFNENEIKYEAMLWLAKSNIQAMDFNRAQPMLDMLLGKIRSGEAPSRLEGEVQLNYAQFSILQKNYDAAVPYITRALELDIDRDIRTRCYFILGQIAQLNGSYDVATQYYKEVIKRTPAYEMSFNAQINMAQCYDATSGDRKYIIKKLTRMAKDDKNKDVLDQIYYALAQVELRDADTAAVIDYLGKSVSTSRTNNYQKAISSLQLADIYFKQKNYPDAQAYYDSTMQFLPKDYPGYKEILFKTSTLTDLVTNLQVIQLEDSLLMLASMPEAQRNGIIDKIIYELIAEEAKRKMEEMEQRMNQMYLSEGRENLIGSVAQEGKWYFYNPTALSNGFTSFIRKYGRRKLEDNWFLSDKTVMAFQTTTGEDTLVSEGDTTKSKSGGDKASDPKQREYYLKNLPDTPEKVAASHDKIIQAYYNLGFIYFDGLKDYPKSIEAFETLLDRYPENKYKAQSIYELYIVYQLLNNQSKSDFYRDMLLTGYAETDYAKLIINPDYYKEINARTTEAQDLYDDTYRAFQNQQYYMVLNNAETALAKFSADTALIPRFAYLRAMALGKIEIIDSLVVALQKIVKDYPKSSVRPLALNALNYLNEQHKGQVGQIITDTLILEDPGQKLYTSTPNSIHFYLLIVDGSKIDVNALRIKISDFNARAYASFDLQVNSILLENDLEMINISNFTDGAQALDYLKSIRSSRYVFTKLENVGAYSDFIISVENYPVFYRSKNVALYQRFFERNYLLN